MLAPYRAIFSRRGTLAFSTAGFVGRMPLAMTGLGIVTMMSQLTGRYGLAGALTATLALAAAVLGPQVSRLTDRHGQRRVMRPAMLISVAAIGMLCLTAREGWPDWLLFVFAATAGCVPNVGSMVRARWSLIYRDDDPTRLHTAYSFESVVDEICFIIGPILAIGLATSVFPEAGLLLAAVFLGVGVWWLTAQRATEPPPHPPGHHAAGSALRTRGLPWLMASFVATGALLAATEVSTVAFAEEEGHKSAASIVLALWALGSGIAGLVFGLVQPKGPLSRRFLLGVAAMAVSMIPLQLVSSLPQLTVALFVSGLAVAPTMVTTMAMVERLVPPSRLTEGMTWVSTGLAVGVALGSAVAGWAIDAGGSEAGYAVPGVSGALAVAVALLGHRRLRSAPAREGTHVAERKQPGDEEQEHVA
ncbi:MFS transporter [Streptomyces sp. NPDC051940]|uniref:MFS transporter n=1 Tax=Streptomyces sp. NPDC051940 TaxID=3155675 RepID=UPI0034287CA1